MLFPILIGTNSIIFGDLLNPKNFGVFREIGEQINECDQKIGLENITIASNYNNIEYLNYYLKKPLSETIGDWSNPETVYQLSDRAKKSNKDYFIYSWSNSFHLPMYFEVIQNHFPFIQNQQTYYGSAFRLYSKKRPRKLMEQKEIIEKNKNNKIQSSKEFFGELKINVSDIMPKIKKGQYVLIKSKGKLTNKSPLLFVVTAERDGEILMNGKNPVLYQAYDQSKILESGKLVTFFNAFEIPKELLLTDKLKIYFWNPENQKVSFEKIRIYFVGNEFQ